MLLHLWYLNCGISLFSKGMLRSNLFLSSVALFIVIAPLPCALLASNRPKIARRFARSPPFTIPRRPMPKDARGVQKPSPLPRASQLTTARTSKEGQCRGRSAPMFEPSCSPYDSMQFPRLRPEHVPRKPSNATQRAKSIPTHAHRAPIPQNRSSRPDPPPARPQC